MTNSKNDGLKLVCRDIQDLQVISSMVQDAIVPVFDMAFLKKERSFVMAINRFCWEKPQIDVAGERVHAGLRFDTVNKVIFKNVNRDDRQSFITILSISYDDRRVAITLSKGGILRLEVDELLCSLRDLNDTWPTIWRPKHSRR